MTTDLHSDLEQLHRQKARLEEDVARLMTVDQLTGLLNRTAFMAALMPISRRRETAHHYQ
jgi:PleD family two-component response regulator